VTGELRLAGAQVGGVLVLEGATVDNKGGKALDGSNLSVGAGLLVVTRSAAGTPGLAFLSWGRISRRSGQLTSVSRDSVSSGDDTRCWSRQLKLSDVRYDMLDPPLSAQERVRWLRRDMDGYVPQNYETLAAMYRGRGDDASARVVLLAKERERRQRLPCYGRAWSWLQDVTVGYGYLLIPVGWILFTTIAAGIARVLRRQ
jgi:hypothetical protein